MRFGVAIGKGEGELLGVFSKILLIAALLCGVITGLGGGGGILGSDVGRLLCAI